MIPTAPPRPELSPTLISRLAALVRSDQVLIERDEKLVYECDGYLVERKIPDVVVFPETTSEVQQIVKFCFEQQIPCHPRGAGTSLAGGCLPTQGSVLICLTRLNRILEIDLPNRLAKVEAGCINGLLNRTLVGTGFHFAPDPSSANASTLGGNVATNAGGPHTLKYGVTANHVLGLTVVLPDGSLARLGGDTLTPSGIDLCGLFVGSEGTFGLCTEVTLRLTPNPQASRTRMAVFDSVRQACEVVSNIIGSGLIPAALELMDQAMLRAMEDKYHFGLPVNAGAILIIEVDGCEASIDKQAERIVDLCLHGHATEIRSANTPEERVELWKCRKQAFGAIGKLSSGFLTQDGVVPRSKLPEILDFVEDVARRYDLKIFNVFHAGDGNIHPIILFDERNAELMQRVMHASEEILSKCVDLGGTVTGEHGIGVEKIAFMSRMYSPVDLEVFQEVRDAFRMGGICTPGKIMHERGYYA
jgi:glycolate oxidase